MTTFNLADLEIHIDDAFLEFRRREEVRRLRQRNPWAADLIRQLLPYPQGRHRRLVISALEAERTSKGLPVPKQFEATVQSAYNQHCLDSAVFQKSGRSLSEGLFYSPHGKGSGYWAVDRVKVPAWLRSRNARGE